MHAIANMERGQLLDATSRSPSFKELYDFSKFPNIRVCGGHQGLIDNIS
jgi:hypothetical protein